MKKDGLTLTMVFLAESANYGEGVGNITTLKKMTRGDYQQYSYISRQAIRYNLVQQLNWDDTPVEEWGCSVCTVRYNKRVSRDRFIWLYEDDI